MTEAGVWAALRSKEARMVADALQHAAGLTRPEARRILDHLQGRRPTPGGDGGLAQALHAVLLDPDGLQLLHDDPEAVWDAICYLWPGVSDAVVVRAIAVAQEIAAADLAMIRGAAN